MLNLQYRNYNQWIFYAWDIEIWLIWIFFFKYEYIMKEFFFMIDGMNLMDMIYQLIYSVIWNNLIKLRIKGKMVCFGLTSTCESADQELMPGTARQELMPGTAPTGLQVDQPARSSCLGQPARSLCLGQPLTGFGTWDSRPGAHPGTVLKDFLKWIRSGWWLRYRLG